MRTAALLALAAVAVTFAADTPENPRDVGLVERAATRLAQIDVTVTGSKGTIEGLTASDFEVRLNDKLLPKFYVDDLCVARGAEETASVPAPAAPATPGAPAAAPLPRPGTATYLLYFDMAHLTQAGRQNSIESAREMVPKLLAGGNRAMVIVSAKDLKTVISMTSDVAKLSAGLTAMVTDRELFDPYAIGESKRRDDIVHEMALGVDSAMTLARRYASEERWRQERDLRRLSMTLGRMAEFDPPKAVLYFADTMRQNAGEHYLSFFSGTAINDTNGKPGAQASAILLDAATGALPLDRVVNEASAMGIRFYTVEGEGINAPSSNIETGRSASSLNNGSFASASVNTQQLRDSQGTLTSLAAETGGRAFLNGVAPARMASQILGDMSCLYLLSFDPAGFPQDKPISVSVVIKKPKVRATARGRLVIQSESARATARVMSAFAAPGAGNAAADSALRVGMIPIGFADGRYTARVQVALNGSRIPGATWDIGASIVSKGTTGDEGSGRIQTAAPNTPVVFEQDMTFAPGEYDLVTVAREIQTDTVLSKETHGSWPKIDADLVSLSPISVSQPQAGGFLKNGVKKTDGAMVVGPDDPLRAEAAAAVITLVCRAKDQKKPFDVVRTLVGEQETPVGKTRIEPTADRCAQVVDIIPPKTLGAGTYRFVLTVSSDGTELARAERSLAVPAPAPAAVKSGS